ncbi:MAG: hypothetical protein IJ009_02185 [Clostridia bacterium]|nr:hypothetical protein [Clostridia bacterium]
MNTPKQTSPQGTRGHSFFKGKASSATHGSPHTEKKAKERRKEKTTELPEGFSYTEGGIAAHRILSCEGIAIFELRAFFALPQNDAKDKMEGRADARIRDFYLTLAERTGEYVYTWLLPEATRAYQESTDPHKRFRHARLSLSVDSRVTQENDLCFSVLRQVRFFRRGECLHEHREAEVLSKKSGYPLPLTALRRLGFSMADEDKKEKADQKEARKAKKKAAFSGFFLSDGKIVRIKEENS